MIRKLRRKFVLINMATVGVVLMAVLMLLIFSTMHQQALSAERALNLALDLRGDTPEMRRFDKPRDDQLFLPLQQLKQPNASSFCVELDEAGEPSAVYCMNLTLSDEDVSTAVNAALDIGRAEGKLYGLGLSFRIRQEQEGMRIAFVDCAGDWMMLRQMIVTCAMVFVLAMLAMLGISLFLAHWALRPAQRAWDQQRQFVADASHELKTPLTVILANTGLLLANPDETVRAQRRWVENTREEGLRMKKLVDDLLFLARADADRVKAPRTSVNFSDAVWSAVLPFEAVAFEKGLDLRCNIQSDVTVSANQQQLQQAVGILVDNACKYADEGGTVTITLLKAQGKAHLTVHNTGAPIPPEALPHLFERFYRADFSRERDAGGYGLGLSILDTIVHTFGGRVSVESGTDKGTSFAVHLPCEGSSS